MHDDLDLGVIERHHDAEPRYREHLRRRVAAILDGSEAAPPTYGGSPDPAVIDLDPRQLGPSERRRRHWLAPVVTIAVAAAAIVAILFVTPPDDAKVSTDQPAQPTSSFVGEWITDDADGGTPTMTIQVAADATVQIKVLDGEASVCAGAPSTLTGTGEVNSSGDLVIAAPELTCDDGSTPQALGGPPLEEQLRNLTFTSGGSDTLTDSMGSTWRRLGASAAPTVVQSEQQTSGGMWPQSTLDEVRAAQELADAGDPAYTWQLDANLAADEEPWGARIFAQFIEEELGWEEFAGASFAGFAYADGGGRYDSVLFIRCAPGQTNPLSPLYAESPPEIRACGPTIDELTYETVGISVSQPAIRGPSGIWVVDRWEIRQSEPDSSGLFGLLGPDYLDGQTGVEQLVPPSDADVTAFVEAFLQARTDGEGAERYLLSAPVDFEAVPLLYAATSGAPYDRSTFERVRGPVWPNGWTEYKVRLFAEDETVVEQHFQVVQQGGRLGVAYETSSDDPLTTENGLPVAVPHSVDLGSGRVTFTAPPLVPRGDGVVETTTTRSDGRVIIVFHDGSGCGNGPARPDAEALARSIAAVPDLETTEPVPVRIAGVDGLQMDVRFSEENNCNSAWMRRPPPGDPGWRMRLYLFDMLGDLAPAEDPNPTPLTIAVIAPETQFERVLEDAAPIVESLEFHPGPR